MQCPLTETLPGKKEKAGKKKKKNQNLNKPIFGKKKFGPKNKFNFFVFKI